MLWYQRVSAVIQPACKKKNTKSSSMTSLVNPINNATSVILSTITYKATYFHSKRCGHSLSRKQHQNVARSRLLLSQQAALPNMKRFQLPSLHSHKCPHLQNFNIHFLNHFLHHNHMHIKVCVSSIFLSFVLLQDCDALRNTATRFNRSTKMCQLKKKHTSPQTKPNSNTVRTVSPDQSIACVHTLTNTSTLLIS